MLILFCLLGEPLCHRCEWFLFIACVASCWSFDVVSAAPQGHFAGYVGAMPDMMC